MTETEARQRRDSAFFAWICAKRQVSTIDELIWERNALEGARLAWEAWQATRATSDATRPLADSPEV